MNPPALSIRTFQPADTDAVVQLWRDCGLTRPWNDPYKDIARKLTVQPELFLVGTSGYGIVASIMGGYDGHRGWVNYLAVAPAYQRRGYATALMEAVEHRFVAMGCPKINLLVRGGNEAVVAFYRRLAFQQDEVISLGKRLIPDIAPEGPRQAASQGNRAQTTSLSQEP
ncbi:GNAT family acetyltransferase [Bordetella petrii]|uniref:GNAT family acetyltransferase n=1 Tax=Bordetella petrii TaxID=94624 RepID=UPI001E450B4E|nr:GNAT family acetyltransferase [Bordetella petrii]MCD0502784.1 GNAT family acetyltransferase [Bordetella petrii]